MSCDIHVLIPSNNQRDTLLRCLDSLCASHEAPRRILVVDDGSRDDTVASVREHASACEVLALPENRGFGHTCNAGFQRLDEAGAEWVLLLNQDTLVDPEMLGALARFADRHPSAGIVGPKTFSFDPMPDGRPRLIYAGSWQGRLPLGQRIPGIGRAEDDPRSEAARTDYVWGHGMLIRMAALREVGGFDTEYPMYYEDLDLCRRMRAAGYEIWCERKAVVWHDQPDGARAVRSEAWRWACKVRSTGVFHRKHASRLSAPFFTALTFADDLRRLLMQRHVRAARHLFMAALRHGLGLSDELRPPSARAVTPLDAEQMGPAEASG